VNLVLITALVVLFFLVIGMLTTSMEFKKRKLYHTTQNAYNIFLVKGVNNISVGLALYLGLYTIGKGPWLLGGLIPLFIGNMYVLFYLLGKESS